MTRMHAPRMDVERHIAPSATQTLPERGRHRRRGPGIDVNAEPPAGGRGTRPAVARWRLLLICVEAADIF